MNWVVTDVGPSPREEDRVWGPFGSKSVARRWAVQNLCECCTHKIVRLYGPDDEDE